MKFLSAEWRDLIVVNYEIDPAVLESRIPAGTELDLWDGKAFVSLVAFMFLNTRLLGLPIPFHQTFEEINLRFYLRCRAPEGWRRGVCFVKELVPRRAIAAVARGVYNENYFAVPMSHTFSQSSGQRDLEYSWREAGGRHSVSASINGAPQELAPESFNEFILEHYWGYTRQRNGSTIEYRVEHPRWRVWTPQQMEVKCDVRAVYGAEFVEVLGREPASAIVAEGSQVVVYSGKGI